MTSPSLHPRDLRSNIWRGILSATSQEITDGMDFYPGAHGLCRAFSALSSPLSDDAPPALSARSVAGIYAALSPMNGWYSNVSNVLDVIRYGFSATVNTTHINFWKALAIRYGADPSIALGRGRKVQAFFRAISDPADTSPVPVDRHLICLALGQKITSNQDLRSLASSHDLYSKIESAYSDLGRREGIGNRLASIAWFVQRRVESGQQLLLQPSELVCCQRPMIYETARARFSCKSCRRTMSRKRLDHGLLPRAKSIPAGYHDGYPFFLHEGRRRLYLGRSHPLADKNGHCYLARYLVAQSLGRKLRADEYVDHKNTNKLDDRLDNYRVMLSESHGRHHTYLAELAGGRGPDGRFREYEVPIDLLTTTETDSASEEMENTQA